MTTEKELDPTSPEGGYACNVPPGNPYECPGTNVVIEAIVETETHSMIVDSNPVVASSLQSVIGTNPDILPDRKATSPVRVLDSVEKRSHKRSRGPRELNTASNVRHTSLRSVRSPPVSMAHDMDKRSAGRKIIKRTPGSPSESSKSLIRSSKSDVEESPSERVSAHDKHRSTHRSRTHTVLSETLTTERTGRKRLRLPKYIRPVDSSRGRRARALLSSPSMASVVSTTTTLTDSTSGNNSTINPESSPVLLLRPAAQSEENAGNIIEVLSTHNDTPIEQVDVFSFLDPDSLEDQSGWQSHSSSPSSVGEPDDSVALPRRMIGSKLYSILKNSSFEDRPPAYWQEQDTLHSDSGISMGDSSPDFDRTPLHYQQRPYHIERSEDMTATANSHPSHSRKNGCRATKLRFSDQPTPARAYAPTAPSQVSQPRVVSVVSAPAPQAPIVAPPDHVGYGLLAVKLSASHPLGEVPDSSGPLPLYRRFEALNHRVLLHLQDELMELEHQLRCMDDCIERQSYCTASYSSTNPQRDSRRGGMLHEERTEILGRIFQKLDQYNQFLASVKVSNDLARCRPEEVDSYKDWLRKSSPIVESETRFLEHEDDLIRIPKAERSEISDIRAILNSHVCAALTVALLLTILTYALVKGWVGRLISLCMIVAGMCGGIWWVESELARPLGKEGLTWSGLCLGAMVVCAVALN